MSVLTLAQIKSEVTTILGGRTDIESRLNNMVNLSQLRLARLHDFDELRAKATIDTVITANAADDKIVSLSTLARYRKIYSIRLYSTNQRSRKLKKILSKNWDRRIPEPEFYSRGIPEAYTLWGKDTMELWRVPDIVYTMHFRYSRWPNLVTDADDGNNLDLENIDDLIIHLTGSYAALSLGHMEKSNELFSIYRTLAREAIGEDDEDFERSLTGMGDSLSSSSLGYDDPFVRSVEVSQA